MASQIYPEREPAKVADLLQDIGKDVRRIATDEIDLARGKVSNYLEKLVLQAAGAIVGGCVALIGLGLLCLAAVAALEPVIASLALRLLIMSFVYLITGACLAYAFAKHLLAIHGPNLDKQVAEVGETVDAVKKGLKH